MPQKYQWRGETNSAIGGAAVTPSDTLFLASGTTTDDGRTYRALYIGVSGTLSVLMADGTTLTFIAVPVGFLPLAVKRVNATGTTAASIIALD